MKSLQTRIYDLLEGSVENKAARACEIFIASVVVLNVSPSFWNQCMNCTRPTPRISISLMLPA
jgi:hypothetical protein